MQPTFLLALTLAFATPALAQAPEVSTAAYGPDNPRPGSARAALRATMQERPGEAMPIDRAALDAALARGEAVVLPMLRAQADPRQQYLDLNWERARLYDGAGFGLSLAYTVDLWRVAPHLPADGRGANGDTPELVKETAVAFALYTLALTRLDGLKCADPSAASHRLDQLASVAAPILHYGRSLPVDQKTQAVSVAVNVERATAPARRDDAVLCSGGLDEIHQGLAANGDRPLPTAPEPGYVGTVTRVPDAPAYKPAFLAPGVWRPKLQAARATLRRDLEQVLVSSPTSEPPASSPAPR